MRRFIIFISVLIFVAVGCSDEIHIHSGHDPKIGLSRGSSYQWFQNTDTLLESKAQSGNKVLNTQLRNAIDNRLLSIGLTRDTSQADLLVHYHLVMKDEVRFRPRQDEYYNPNWLSAQMETLSFLESSLIIDLVDFKSGNVVWWGAATEILPQDSTVLTAGELNRIVKKIFKTFPSLKKAKDF